MFKTIFFLPRVLFFSCFQQYLNRIVCFGRTELKLETLEDAVLLDDEDNDTLTDKRGCPAYVSPEILRSHARYSGRAADMWSLGVILYTMLVGRCVHSISNSLTVTSHWSGISMLPVPDAHCCDKFAFHCTTTHENAKKVQSNTIFLLSYDLSLNSQSQWPQHFDRCKTHSSFHCHETVTSIFK